MKLNTIQRKKFRIRNKLKKYSANDRYRLSVSRSLKNFSAQIIDDVNNKTLLSASSIEKDIKNNNKSNKTSLSIFVFRRLLCLGYGTECQRKCKNNNRRYFYRRANPKKY